MVKEGRERKKEKRGWRAEENNKRVMV